VQQAQKSQASRQARPETSTFRWVLGHVFSLFRRHGGAIITLWLPVEAEHTLPR